MKFLKYLSLALSSLFPAFAASLCAADQSSPEALVGEVQAAMVSCDPAAFLPLSSEFESLQDSEKEIYQEMLGQVFDNMKEDTGGLKEIQIVSSSLTENGAILRVKFLFLNGTDETDTMNMSLVGDKWFLSN